MQTPFEINSLFLFKRIPPENKRFPTFIAALNLIDERGAKTLVETGTARFGYKRCDTDGCSTIIFSHFAQSRGLHFYSIDNCPDAIKASYDAVAQINPRAHLILEDSISYLRNFNSPIDFLYLDSYDFDSSNPKPSQMHHLHEIQAAFPHLHNKSIVLIDDCDLPHGGKGKLAIEWLCARGWKVLMSHYQTLLVYTETEL